MANKKTDPPSAKIYTRTGDAGETDLLGGARVAKDHPRLEALGTLDELNAHLGVARSQAETDWLRDRLVELQDLVRVACSEVVCANADAHAKLKRTIGSSEISRLEEIIDDTRQRVPIAPSFQFPSRPAAVALDVARTVARRAERRLITLARDERVFGEHVPAAINRLSDALFTLACCAEAAGESTKE